MWLSRDELPWSRRLLALVSITFALAAWNGVYLRSAPVFLLGMAALLLHLAHPAAQLTVRAVLGASVFVGVAHFPWHAGFHLHSHLANKSFGVVAAGCALLALGGAGLRTRPERLFAPVAFRRTLLVSLVAALVQMLLLSFVAMYDAGGGHTRRVVFDLACLAALGLGAMGTYRLRSWAPILTWITTAALAVLVAFEAYQVRVAGKVLLHVNGVFGEMTPYWITTSATLLVVMLPLLAAIFRGSADRSAHGA
ncbi:hypothetical protein [Polyangium fumosum]|uniref:Uncharacterized protein n=1 Tax=Polyangium fumosum TaxID=889272 RepID=A0A4U1J7C7_9BACT|nr:hypothetical protein [Polyangium fumosum]TKD03219.1 hypothetical protein E8A74_27290 [Polyangium fumosum]